MFKATNEGGTDFRTGTIDYAGSVGAVVSHPDAKPMIANAPETYLSVSVEPAETLIGGRWPCRLFRVEPIGETLEGLDASPYKRACKSLRVVEELPAHQALGPNGEKVARLIERARKLNAQELDRARAARDAARDAAWDAAWDAARYAARDAARDATWYAAWDAARDAARDAALALTVEDLISPEHFGALTGPWLEAVGDFG